MLHELVVVLAGHATSLQPNEMSPGEADVLLRAARFGRLHAQVRALVRKAQASSGARPMVAEVISETLLNPLMNDIVKLEQSFLSGKHCGTACVSRISTLYSRKLVVAQSVMEPLIAKKALQEVTSALRKAYLEDFELTRVIFSALDKAWIDSALSWALWGEPPHSGQQITLPPSLEDAPTVYHDLKKLAEITQGLRLGNHFAENTDLRRVLEDASHRWTVLPAPIEPGVLQLELEQTQKAISLFIRNSLNPDETNDILSLLRNIALLGSGTFFFMIRDGYKPECCSFSTKNTIAAAYDNYVFEAKEIPPERASFASKTLSFNNQNALVLNVKWPYTALFTATACQRYSQLFKHFLAVRETLDLLSRGEREQFRYLLFYNAMWEWFQTKSSIFIDKFPVLFDDIGRSSGEHEEMLEQLAREVFLDEGPLHALLTRTRAAVDSRKPDFHCITDWLAELQQRSGFEILAFQLQLIAEGL